MLQPDPVAMLTGTVAFLAVLVAVMSVTAVRRRRQRQPVGIRRAGDITAERRSAG